MTPPAAPMPFRKFLRDVGQMTDAICETMGVPISSEFGLVSKSIENR
jgi:hypothetical protein